MKIQTIVRPSPPLESTYNNNQNMLKNSIPILYNNMSNTARYICLKSQYKFLINQKNGKEDKYL